ncbi:MAG TPA: amidase [Leptolyngbyaceae cyanobacterium M65_K2018_010]|nr:amidase [Leptolyngbyaceae cyanobacterium M65_K2018_010]
MNSVDLAFLPALEQARLIRHREMSPLELTEIYLERIERLNPALGAYVAVMADSAIADAKAKTEYLMTADPAELPPLFGVTVSVKDLNSVAGVACAYGIKAACDRIATEDDYIVRKLRQAGLVILGKTATSQMGSLPYTEPPGFPPARNPWHLDYTPGGSSGGGAAALAAGLCAIAQGSDGGGSLRGPAFCCGLVGLAARGRISFAPVGERLNGLAVNGPLGRTVADTAALLDALSGYEIGDPYWLPDPDPCFLEGLQTPPPPLRIGYATHLEPVGAADQVCQAAVYDTVQRVAALGHRVEEVTFPDLSDLIEPFVVVWQCVLAEAGIPWFVLERMNRWLYWRAWRINSGAYLRAVAQLQRVARQIVQFCYPYDVLILPVYMHGAIRVGQWQSLRSPQILENVINWVAPCPPFNVSGQPALAMPTGFSPAGLPVGVQLVGRPAAEATLLALATQLETIQPFYHHRPAFAS